MTISLALRDLRDSTRQLSDAVTELATIAHEDRPAGSDVAAVDQYVELVTEFQAAVVTAAAELAGLDGAYAVAQRMPRVDDALAHAQLRYWRDLRSHDVVGTMRRAARRGGPDWRAWQGTVEQSQRRCEPPLLDSLAGARRVWLELAELVPLWLTRPPSHTPTTPPTTDSGSDAHGPTPENTWRTA